MGKILPYSIGGGGGAIEPYLCFDLLIVQKFFFFLIETLGVCHDYWSNQTLFVLYLCLIFVLLNQGNYCANTGTFHKNIRHMALVAFPPPLPITIRVNQYKDRKTDEGQILSNKNTDRKMSRQQ